MVNQVCGNCKKVINHVLVICPYCKATKQSRDYGGFVFWRPEETESITRYAYWPEPEYLRKPTSVDSLGIYNEPCYGVSMDAKTRIENAERELSLAKEALETEASLVPQVRSMIRAMSIGNNGYNIISSTKESVTVLIESFYTLVGSHITHGWIINCDVTNGKLRVSFRKD